MRILAKALTYCTVKGNKGVLRTAAFHSEEALLVNGYRFHLVRSLKITWNFLVKKGHLCDVPLLQFSQSNDLDALLRKSLSFPSGQL